MRAEMGLWASVEVEAANLSHHLANAVINMTLQDRAFARRSATEELEPNTHHCAGYIRGETLTKRSKEKLGDQKTDYETLSQSSVRPKVLRRFPLGRVGSHLAPSA